MKLVLNKLHKTIDTILEKQQFVDIDQNNLIELIEQASKILITLRYLSIDAVERICKWRERLAYLASKVPMVTDVNIHDFVYLLDHENYLIKMKTDTNFLKDSVLGGYFNFSSKSDPFLLTPSQTSTSISGNKKKQKKKKKAKVETKPDLMQLELNFEIVKSIKA